MERDAGLGLRVEERAEALDRNAQRVAVFPVLPLGFDIEPFGRAVQQHPARLEAHGVDGEWGGGAVGEVDDGQAVAVVAVGDVERQVGAVCLLEKRAGEGVVDRPRRILLGDVAAADVLRRGSEREKRRAEQRGPYCRAPNHRRR